MAVGTILAPISINATAATNLYIDTQGYKSALIIIGFGVVGAADFEVLTCADSDSTSGAATFTGGAFTLTGSASSDGKTWTAVLDLRKRKRYITALIDPGAVDCLVCAYAVLGDWQIGASTTALSGALNPTSRLVEQRLIV